MLDNNRPSASNDYHRPVADLSRSVPAVNRRKKLSVNRIERFESSEQNSSTHAPTQSRTALTTCGTEFDAQYRSVLQVLWKACQSAYLHRRPDWEFAIEISELIKLGVSRHLLRVMVCEGVVERRREVTTDGQLTRTFVPESGMVLSDHSCFVLSQKGKNEIDKMTMSKEQLMSFSDESESGGPNDGGSNWIPIWDTKRRELRLGDVVIKKFKWPAANQEQILRAFQEEGWPSKIDDPLPPNPKICPKRRLHDTIKCLNRRQLSNGIKFRGDGTGQGVLLEIRDKNEK